MSRYITIDTPPTALDSNGLPYQRLDAPLAAFGGNDAAALGQFSNALDRNVASYRDQLRQQQQLLAHESAANDALTGFRLGAVQAGRQYTGLRMKDAVDGHDGYLQAITQSRDDAIQDLPGPARALLKPHLDRAFNVARQLGQDHQRTQDHAWSDQSSLDSLDADSQEAVLHRNNPDQVQALADRAIGEWAKIGERKGWSMGQIAQQAAQSKAQLFGSVMQAHIDDGRPDRAQAFADQAKGQLDPDTMKQLMRGLQASSLPPGNPPRQQNANPPQQPPQSPNEQPPTEPGELREQNAQPAPAEDGVNPLKPMRPSSDSGQSDIEQTNPRLGQYSNVDPKLVQLAGGGQQIVQSDQSGDDAQIVGEVAQNNLQSNKKNNTGTPPKPGVTPKSPANNQQTLPQTPKGKVLPQPAGKNQPKPPPPVYPNEWPSQPVVGISDEFSKTVAADESGDSYGAINIETKKGANKKTIFTTDSDGKKHPVYLYDEHGNPRWVALGKYQLQEIALKQIGVIGKDRNDWNTKFGKAYGISNFQDFVDNPAAQETAFRLYMNEVWRQSSVAKSTGRIGQTIQGGIGEPPFAISLPGLIAAGHREGAENVRQYLKFMAARNWQSPGAKNLPPAYVEIEKRFRQFADKSYFPNPPYAP